jgi:DHA1 family bicyclomycin/chloramphenicol resistance-like MFS transporter
VQLAWNSRGFTLLLGIFAGLPALSIDLSAPTLVDLPATLHTSITVAGLTLSLFMVGFAIGLVVGGRSSDQLGRRPVLLASIVLYCLAGIVCAAASSGPGLVAARVLQGIGAGACSVMAAAMVQDLFQGEVARRKRSYVAIVNGVVPVMAPALGAWLSAAAGWRSVHVVLAAAGVVLLAIVWVCVGESRPKLLAARMGPVLDDGVPRLRDDRRFLGLALVNALSYGALFAYIAGAPVVTMRNMGLSSGVYAAIFAATALALSAGAFTSARLGGGRKSDAASLIWPSLATQAAATIALALFAAEHFTPPFVLMPLLLLTCYTRGIIAPNLLHLTIGVRKRDAGVASAVVGVFQLGGGALSSAAVAALLPGYGLMAVAATMAFLTGTAAALWLMVALTLPRARQHPAA